MCLNPSFHLFGVCTHTEIARLYGNSILIFQVIAIFSTEATPFTFLHSSNQVIFLILLLFNSALIVTPNYLIGLNIFAANKNNLKNYADNGNSCEYLILMGEDISSKPCCHIVTVPSNFFLFWTLHISIYVY